MKCLNINNRKLVEMSSSVLKIVDDGNDDYSVIVKYGTGTVETVIAFSGDHAYIDVEAFIDALILRLRASDFVDIAGKEGKILFKGWDDGEVTSVDVDSIFSWEY